MVQHYFAVKLWRCFVEKEPRLYTWQPWLFAMEDGTGHFVCKGAKTHVEQWHCKQGYWGNVFLTSNHLISITLDESTSHGRPNSEWPKIIYQVCYMLYDIWYLCLGMEIWTMCSLTSFNWTMTQIQRRCEMSWKAAGSDQEFLQKNLISMATDVPLLWPGDRLKQDIPRPQFTVLHII